MSTTQYKAVCASLLQVDFAERVQICCLCLETLEGGGVSVEDEVVLQIPNHSRPVATTLALIINFLMDKSISDVTLILKLVCKKCAAAAINSYKFIKFCKDNAKVFAAIVNNLETSVAEIPQDTSINSLYIAVEAKEDKSDIFFVKRYYDKNRLFVPKDTAFLRFKNIIENDMKKKMPLGNTNNTFHIEAIDDSLKELLCCKKNISNTDLLNDPEKPYEFKCRVCKQMFSQGTSLRVHFFRVHRNKKVTCKKCSLPNQDSDFTNVRILPIDEKSNTDKEIEYPVEQYESGGDDDWHNEEDTSFHETELIESLDEGEVNQKIMLEILKDIPVPTATGKEAHGMFTCKKCKQKFSTRNRYIKHITTKKYTCKRPPKSHGDFKCHDCGYGTFYKSRLKKHIRFEHLGEKGFVCEHCGRNCYTRHEYTQHTLKHTKEKHFVCDLCGRKYSTNYALKAHLVTHTNQTPFKCHLCEKSFKRSSYISEHFRRDHDNAPASFKCKFCDRLFRFKTERDRHEVRHLKKNNHVDKLCEIKAKKKR